MAGFNINPHLKSFFFGISFRFLLQFSREAVEAVSEAIKVSGDAGIKRKFSDLFQRLDGLATIDGRSLEAVLLDPGKQPSFF